MEKLILPTILVLAITLATMYISKKKKNKLIAALFAISGFAGMLLLISMLYNETIVGKNDLWRFAVISIILIAMVFFETLEILGLIPDRRKTQNS